MTALSMQEIPFLYIQAFLFFSYVKKFEWCTRQARVDTGCDSDPSVLNSVEVQKHLDKASEYSWICDHSGGEFFFAVFVPNCSMKTYFFISRSGS